MTTIIPAIMMVGPCPDTGVIPGIEEETGSSRTVIWVVCKGTAGQEGLFEIFQSLITPVQEPCFGAADFIGTESVVVLPLLSFLEYLMIMVTGANYLSYPFHY